MRITALLSCANTSRFTPIVILAALIAASSIATHPAPLSAQSGQAPGGFVELASSNASRPQPSASQMAGFLPSSRGQFFFPAPYNTEAYRLTTSADCGGGDCVQQAGYSDWTNLNYNTGTNTVRALVSLFNYGGPTLFTVDKTTGTVTNNGSILPSGDPLANNRAEGWYWSESNPDWLYGAQNGGVTLQRINVVSRTQTTIMDARVRPDLWGSDARFRNTHSSADDQVHNAKVIDSSGANRGCAVFNEATGTYRFWPVTVPMQCGVDRSGRYLVIAFAGSSGATDLRWIDLITGQELMLRDPEGAPGHMDRGHGYFLGVDNWSPYPGAWRLWDMSQPWNAPGNGRVVYYDGAWNIDYSQPTWRNSLPASVKSLDGQYACGTGTAARSPSPQTPREREIYCMMLDGSLRTLIVAPNMTIMETGGGELEYFRAPKGNVDPAGQYFFWVSNHGTNRLDAFIVRIPYQVLTGGAGGGGSSDTTAPNVSVTSPAGGTTITGTVAVSATASDNVGVAGVQFRVDGNNLGSEDTTSPYSVNWNTTSVANGSHTLTAVARDAAGNTRTASAVSVTVSNSAPGDTTPPTVSLASPAPGSTLTGSVTVAATASDNVGVAGVQFLLDGANYGSEDTSSPYSIDWNTVTVANGTHVLTARARDAAGNTATSTPRTVTIDNSPTQQPGTGPIAAYGFNESGGTTAADSSPIGNTATLLGATWAAGRYGSALAPNGASLAEAPDHDLLTPGTTATLSAWVYLTSTPTELASIANKWSQDGEDEYLFGVTSDRHLFLAWQTSAGSSWGTPGFNGFMAPGEIPVNNWTHVAVVRNGTSLSFYIDGSLVSSADVMDTQAFRNGSNSLRVGGQQRGDRDRYFPGRIDELRIYRRALTGSEIGSAMYVPVVTASDTIAPTALVTAPAQGATVSGTVSIEATASDNVGVAGVQFRVNGGNIGSELSSAPYSVSWNTTAIANGTYTLTAVARDAAGNTTTSASVTVTVSNGLPVSGLVAAYSFNEDTGTRAGDSSPTGSAATLTGAAGWASGRYGSALALNGAGYADAGDVLAHTPGTAATFAAWVMLTDTPIDVASIFNKWSQSTSDEYLVGLDANRRPFFAWRTAAATLTYGMPSFNEARGNAQVPMNVWTHVAVVRNGALLSFYVNGALVSQLSAMDNSPFRDGSNTLRIGGQGRSGKDRYFPGRIDDARIYNRALTQAEIQAAMNAGVGGGF